MISKIDARNGAFGIVPDELDGAVVTGSFQAFTINATEIVPDYLLSILTHPLFYEPISSHVSGATGRRTITGEKFLSYEIPLPPVQDQQSLSQQVLQLRNFADAGERTLNEWRVDSRLFHGTQYRLAELASIGTGSTPSRSNPAYFGGDTKWVLTTEICESEIHDTAESLTEQAVRDFNLRVYPPSTILLAMYGQGQTRGRTAFLRIPAAITQNCAAIVANETKVLPEYIWFNLMARYEEIRAQEYSGGGVPHLNAQIISEVMIPVPALENQRSIVSRICEERRALQVLKAITETARVRADEIVRRIMEES